MTIGQVRASKSLKAFPNKDTFKSNENGSNREIHDSSYDSSEHKEYRHYKFK